MQTKVDKGLIGFDPLAWMNEESDGEETNSGVEQTIENKPQINSSATSVETKESSEDGIESESNVVTKAPDITELVDRSKIELAATLNIQNVTELHEHLVKCLDAQDLIEIDASAVTLIDTANLQMLIVLKQTAIKLHKEVIIDFPSDKFIEAAELLGLSEMLGVDQSAAGFF